MRKREMIGFVVVALTLHTPVQGQQFYPFPQSPQSLQYYHYPRETPERGIPRSAYPLGDGRLLEAYMNFYFEQERAKLQAHLLNAQTRNFESQRKLLEEQRRALPSTPPALSENQKREAPPPHP